jgi:hypothetical protein
VLDQFDKLLRLTDGRARRGVDVQRRKTARQRLAPPAGASARGCVRGARCDRASRAALARLSCRHDSSRWAAGITGSQKVGLYDRRT